LHGRNADMVNIAGKRTSIAHLNHQLTAIPGVRDGCFLMPDESATAGGITRLCAFVVAPTLSPAQLREALRARIDPIFLPRPMLFVDRLPRNATGKLPRRELIALLAGQSQGAQ
jgi:acyl-coenzyme A synthetase/AMP-(fatty) acid ligase